MAQWYDQWTDFSWNSAGSSPSDWTIGGDMYLNATVVQSGNDKYFRFAITPSNGGGWSMYQSWVNTTELAGDLGQAESLVRYRLNSMNDSFVGPIVRANTSPTTSYAGIEEFTAAGPSTAFKLYRINAMSQAQIGSTINDSPYIQANTWNWIRVRANGPTIYAKHWKDGQSEPGSWEVSGTDNTFYNTNFGVRIGAYMNNPSATTFDVSYFACASNGYSAPKATGVAAFNAPAAAFNTDPVQFTDASYLCRTSWSWDFGDGFTSTAQNPTHAYSTPGTYTVTQTVSGACGSSSTTKQIVVSKKIFATGISSVTGVSSITL